ncbi:MAG: 2-oxoacid:acceptor oxidoreductase family protein [Coriobacteriia bacterium]|jgi:2-oxoglutarate ferredoxin oxidoreductase subunit gamma|nr:2-oxoacid:acceptor oxidoreductase family protein [Coriobacteriia bacterium]MDR2714063.1 2-oxoacid:acceptor oxidoreductase family protein [Coriobacteriales bacterium]
MANLEIMLAGFGGQGILFSGKLVAYSGLFDGRELSWLPSYGPEMRGGTANCSVCLSDEAIGSPLVINPDILVAMNMPSFDKFVEAVKPNGIIIVDSSIADACCMRKDVSFYRIPATQLAEENGLKGLANVIMVGKLLQLTEFSTLDSLDKAIEKSVSAKRAEMVGFNKKALRVGYEYVDQKECE